VHDAQLEPNSALGSRGASLEQSLLLVRWSTGAIGGDGEAVGKRASRHRWAFTAVFDSVAEQILEELLGSAGVCRNLFVGRRPEGCGGRVDSPPATAGECRQVDGLGFVDIFALSCDCENVFDDGFHPFVGVRHVVEILAGAVLSSQFESKLGDVERVAQVVADDAGELVESLAFRLQFPPSLFAVADIPLDLPPRERRRIPSVGISDCSYRLVHSISGGVIGSVSSHEWNRTTVPSAPSYLTG
jgi:hypothetical protein